jgi:hypothetical protein
VKLPAYKARHQNNIFLFMIIQAVFPSLAKRGQGRFFNMIIHKIPLNPVPVAVQG